MTGADVPGIGGSLGSDVNVSADGTDLRLDVTKRTWVNSDGQLNMPSGEVFTGPKESSASGHIRFTVPSSPAGVDVAGVELDVARAHAGGNSNVLTDEEAVEPLTGTAVLNGIPVEVTPVTADEAAAAPVAAHGQRRQMELPRRQPSRVAAGGQFRGAEPHRVPGPAHRGDR